MKQQLLKDNELKRKKTGKFIEDDDEEIDELDSIIGKNWRQIYLFIVIKNLTKCNSFAIYNLYDCKIKL